MRGTARFLKGDRKTIREIRSSIEVVVRKFGFRNRDVEEELVQETIGRLFVSLAHGRFEGKSLFKTYASNVAKYVCLEHVRRWRRAERYARSAALLDSSDTDPEAALLRAEQNRRYLCAFAALPDEERELLSLIFIRQLSYRDIATRLGLSEGAVRVRVHRCRAKLWSSLEVDTRTRAARTDARIPSQGSL